MKQTRWIGFWLAVLMPVGVFAQQWTMDPAKMMVPLKPVAGKIHGRDFVMDEAKLENNVLEIRMGKDFFPDLAVNVFLFLKDGEKVDGKTFRVGPTSGFGSPHVHLKWKPDKERMPETEMYMEKYAMVLEFGRTVAGKTPGKVYICLPDASKSVVAGTFTLEIFDYEHPLGSAAGISGKVFIKSGPREIELYVNCLGKGPEGRLESAGAGFKIGEGSYLANLNNKPRITALATDKKTGIITHWHNNRPPGWYLVLLPGPAHRIPQGSDSWSVVHEGYYDWKWVELTGPTSQVAADLTVDPANLGTVAVTVSNAPAQASVTYLPLRADGKLPWPEAHYYLHGVSSVGVTNGQAAIRYLREGRYQLALINKDRWGSEAPVTTDVEVKRGMTTKAELISKEPVKPVPITQPKPVTPTPAPTKPVAPVTPSIPAVKPTAPVGNTKNLLLTAKMSASSMWSSDFAAGKAADGNGSSRWNSKPNDDVGAWLAARWDQPVTIRKIVIRQAYDRLIEFTMQRFDAAKNDWVDMMHVFPNRHTSSFSPTGEKLGWSVHPDDVYVDGRRLADCKERKFAQADPNAAVNPVFTLNLRGAPATTGIRLVAKQVNGITISIFEMEAW